MIHSTDISVSADDLDDFAPLKPIPVWNPIQFFTLRGRTTTITRDNLICLENVQYCVYSPLEKRYYQKTYRNYDLDMMFWYRRSLTFSGEDEAVEQLRNYIYDKNVSLLLNEEEFESIQNTLGRLWKSKFVGESVVRYKHYINLLDQYIRYEDYKEYSIGLIGHKTVCAQFEGRIKGIWDEIYRI